MAEDHTAVRQGFVSILKQQENFDVVGEAGNGHELLAILENTSPDILLIDIEMPLMSGYEALKTIVSKYPKVRSIMFSMHGGDYFISELIIAGASAYLHKNCEIDELVTTINKVFKEGYYFNENISKKVVANSSNDVKFKLLLEQIALSEREVEILKAICAGKKNKEIADDLNISCDTIEFHRKNIYRKTCASNIVDLVKYAIKHGLTAVN